MIAQCAYLFDKTTVNGRLTEWAAWKMDSGVALGYPSESAFLKMNVDNGKTKESYAPINQECSLLNGIIDDLPHLHHIIIRVEYLSGYKDSEVKAHIVGVSRRTYYNYLDRARELIANSLNISLIGVRTCDINVLRG